MVEVYAPERGRVQDQREMQTSELISNGHVRSVATNTTALKRRRQPLSWLLPAFPKRSRTVNYVHLDLAFVLGTRSIRPAPAAFTFYLSKQFFQYRPRICLIRSTST